MNIKVFVEMFNFRKTSFKFRHKSWETLHVSFEQKIVTHIFKVYFVL